MKLGELLIKAKVISEMQLKTALQEQAKWGGKIGEVLVRMNFVTEDVLVKALAKLLNIPRVDLDTEPRPADGVVKKIPHEVARDLGALAMRLEDDGKSLVVAMAEPSNLRHLDAIRSVTKLRVKPAIAGAARIARAIASAYEGEADLGAEDAPFKVVDAQGRTLVKPLSEITGLPRATAPPVARSSLASIPVAALAPARAAPQEKTPRQLLETLETAQRSEVVALKAMVDLLVEKGVFTKDEYLARVRK